MTGLNTIVEVLENATYAELLEELELLILHEDKYPKAFKILLLAELEKRQIKKEVEE